MKAMYVVSIVFLCSHFVVAQNYTINGYIHDASNNEKLIGANIMDHASQKGTISNTFGFYSISLPGDTIILRVSYIGFEDQQFIFNLDQDTTLNIYLNSSVQLDQVEIVSSRTPLSSQSTQMSRIDIPVNLIQKVPALLGEVDVLKTLQLLPGIQSGSEGQNGLYVRGGSPDQNLILFDGVPVYNVSHLFGFFSVFNADAIKDVSLIKGGFPARYGGRLSSVININMKDGNQHEFHGAGSIGIISSKLTLEGPIKKGKSSFLISGRRTYIDLLAQPFIKKSIRDEGNEGSFGYYFYDLNLKFNHTFNDRDRIFFSSYKGRDAFYFELKDIDPDYVDFTKNDINWGNFTNALRWNHLFTNKLFANTTFTHSNYNLDFNIGFGSEDLLEDRIENIDVLYGSGITDYSAKIDFDFLPNPDHYIRFGGQYIFHNFDPGLFTLNEIDNAQSINFNVEIGQDRVRASEFALYFEDDFIVNKNIKINLGIHSSAFKVQNTWYHSVQPRISSRFLISEKTSFKASYSQMRQYIHLLAFEGVGLPADLWLPSTDDVEPQFSWQLAGGFAHNINSKTEISIEAYYKKMDNVISYKEGSGLFELTDWQERVTQGTGFSYGAELFFQKKIGRLTGWIGYTLSWTNRQFDDINNGKVFPYKYDRRHDISVVANYKLGDRVNVSGSWVFGTGNAISLSNTSYKSLLRNQNYDVEYFGTKNNFRMNNYHRFDIGFNFEKQKKKYLRTWSLGVYNAYSRKNPFFIYTDTERVQDPQNPNQSKIETRFKQASLFPIIPYISYSFKF